MEKKKRKWKNKKFNIFGDVWTIVFCDKVTEYRGPDDENHYMFGLSDSINKKVCISTVKPDGKPLSDREIITTIAHECTHAILASGQYLKECEDEALVEFLAKGILSLIKSKVFDYETEDLGQRKI